MKVYQTNEIKNIAILGSSGTGKTTLSETMLYQVGAIKRRGSVKDGSTANDTTALEKEYGYSVFSSVVAVPWANRKLNFIDCPGSDDFIGATVNALTMTDTALMLIHAGQGIEVGTINQFRYTDKYNKPVVFAINQLDHENVDFDNVVTQLKERYSTKIAVAQFPVTTGPGFTEIVDVIAMKLYRYGADGGKAEVLDIPAELEDKAMEYHMELVETAAGADDSLLEAFFENDSLTPEQMSHGLRAGLISGDVYPVFCISAEKNIGVCEVMDFLAEVAPASNEVDWAKRADDSVIEYDAEGPTSLFFFKTMTEQHIGQVNYFKVMSGTVHEGDDLLNIDRNENRERITQIYVPQGSNRVKIGELKAGDIGAAVKLKDVHTGNTLNEKDCNYKYKPVPYPTPKYRRAIKAVNESDSEKMNEAINNIHEEDPTIIIEQSKELRQTIVHGQGEFHLRTLKWRLENEENIEVEYLEPRIPYRETISKASRSDYRHKKQSGGAGQFGEVHLIVEPYEEGQEVPKSYKFGGQEFKIQVRDTEEIDLEWGGKLVFVNSIVGGAIDTRFLPAILKGIMGRMERGPLTGSYARDVRVIVYDGKMHDVDSNEVSFMIAGRTAFSNAFREAAPKILEPIYNVVVSTPTDAMGDVMSDIQTRRGLVMGMESKGGYEELRARVPLKELSNYSTALSSITGGRATFTMEFDKYELVPGDIQQQLLDAYEEEDEDE